MAYYAYKCVRDIIPQNFQDEYIKKFKEETGSDYDGGCDYDGDMWYMVEAYIITLHDKIKTLSLIETEEEES